MPIKTKQDPNNKDKFLIEKKTNFYFEFDKTVPDLIEIYQSIDKPIAVLGGGPSLPEDLKKIPKDCILISANHHAFKLVVPDFICFLDPPDHAAIAADVEYKRITYNPGTTKRISYANLTLTDYYCINEAKFHTSSDTGIFSTWVASYIGKNDIYLCGFGLRNSKEAQYFHEMPAGMYWGGPSQEVKSKRWEDLRDDMERPERVKAVSGPLQKVFL
jgi:hypothetical protein